MVAWKNKDQRIGAHAPVAQIFHILFRPDEGRIELAPNQGLGEHGRVIARQADVDAGKFLAQHALHLR